jgi:hemerythrin-like domain-containing protein
LLGERMAAQCKNGDADPIAFLVDDHERLQKLFRGFEAAEGGAVRRALAERACAELKIHAALEAEIFYPAARAALGTKGGSIVKRAEAEHAAAARLIAALEDPASDDISYADAFARLAALVKHHIEREEREIFARFRQCSPDLGSIAARLRRRKDALLRAEDVPGQIEPSAEAEGEYEPDLDEALARRLAR